MRTLAARGYQEVDHLCLRRSGAAARSCSASSRMIELANPIAADMAVMRSSLWPGLIGVARENLRRQQPARAVVRDRQRFLVDAAAVAAFASRRCSRRWRWDRACRSSGAVRRRRWISTTSRAISRRCWRWAGQAAEFLFEPAALACLHPGRSARIVRGGVEIGASGRAAPAPGARAGFNICTNTVRSRLWGDVSLRKWRSFAKTSRYPLIRRDISFTVPEAIAFRRIGERVSVAAASLLQELRVFDVYQGKGVESGRKSVALGLILQDLSRTLTDEEADRVGGRQCAPICSRIWMPG